jgi:hypothetical protein
VRLLPGGGEEGTLFASLVERCRNLRSGFGTLYAAHDDIFSGFSGEERAVLFHGTAERWYAQRGG